MYLCVVVNRRDNNYDIYTYHQLYGTLTGNTQRASSHSTLHSYSSPHEGNDFLCLLMLEHCMKCAEVMVMLVHFINLICNYCHNVDMSNCLRSVVCKRKCRRRATNV